jgi:hypothetical protein
MRDAPTIHGNGLMFRDVCLFMTLLSRDLDNLACGILSDHNVTYLYSTAVKLDRHLIEAGEMERTSAAEVPMASLGQRSRTPNKWVASNRTSMLTLASPAQWVHQNLVNRRKFPNNWLS